MIAIRTAAALLVFCCVALPAMAQNARPAVSGLPPGIPAPPPSNAIPGTLDLATRQFTPMAASTTPVTVINKVYTFTPDFSKIGPEAAIIHTITCGIIVGPYFQDAFAEATNQFDPENPPATLSIHVLFTAYVPNPTLLVRRFCSAYDDNDEFHLWNDTPPYMPVDKVPTNYTDAVVF
jgi:hypothetical protein